MSIVRLILRRIYLFFFLVRKHLVRSFFSSIGLFITLTVVLLILGVLRPIKDVVIKKVKGSLPGQMIKVRAKPRKPVSIIANLFSQQKDMKLGVSDKRVKQIKNLKGVSYVYKTQLLQRPLTVNVPFLGLRLDAVLQGIDSRLAKPYLKCMRNFKAKGNVIPMVLPESIPELFYTYSTITFSQNINLKQLVGTEFNLALNNSTLKAPTVATVLLKGKLCGFVPEGYVSLIGVPLNWVKKIHQNYGQTTAQSHYDQLFVRVKNHQSVKTVKSSIARKGLLIRSDRRSYKNLNSWLNRIDDFLWVFAFVLFLLSSIALVNSFMLLSADRKYEFGLLLMFGSSSTSIWVITFLEGAMWGALHSIMSIFLCEYIFQALRDHLHGIAALKAVVDLTGLEFAVSSYEKGLVIWATALFAGLASLLPVLFLIGRNTLHLIKKD